MGPEPLKPLVSSGPLCPRSTLIRHRWSLLFTVLSLVSPVPVDLMLGHYRTRKKPLVLMLQQTYRLLVWSRLLRRLILLLLGRLRFLLVQRSLGLIRSILTIRTVSRRHLLRETSPLESL